MATDKSLFMGNTDMLILKLIEKKICMGIRLLMN
jgi:hypothetical protein